MSELTTVLTPTGNKVINIDKQFIIGLYSEFIDTKNIQGEYARRRSYHTFNIDVAKIPTSLINKRKKELNKCILQSVLISEYHEDLAHIIAYFELPGTTFNIQLPFVVDIEKIRDTALDTGTWK